MYKSIYCAAGNPAQYELLSINLLFFAIIAGQILKNRL
jgi:hypothetical protein